jgi:hypothetical protein
MENEVKETEEQRAERKSLYESFKASGKGITGYAREIGKDYWKVRTAVRKSKSEELEAAGFREVEVPKRHNHNEQITVVLRGGRELRISSGMPSLEQLIKVLERC